LLRASQRWVTGRPGGGAAKGAFAEMDVAAGKSAGSSRSCKVWDVSVVNP
jgi:hypothetical protein